MKFVIKQAVKEDWEKRYMDVPAPVFVHPARWSPNHGTAAMDEVVAQFATVDEAKAWVAAQGGRVVRENWKF